MILLYYPTSLISYIIFKSQICIGLFPLYQIWFADHGGMKDYKK